MGDTLDPSRGPWQQRLFGAPLYVYDPRPEDFDLREIAHAHALDNRFAGHSRWPDSVAEHCVRASRAVEAFYAAQSEPEDREVVRRAALAALLHDSPEAYLRDIPRPLKRSPDFAFYRELEALYAEGLEAWAGLPRGAFDWPIVKWADQVMLRTEKRDLLYPSRFAWGFAPGAPFEPLPARTHLWTLTGFATWLRELPGVAWGQGLAGLRGALAELAASGPWPWWLAERRFLARWKELQS